MEIADNEIVVRNSKTSILIRAGFVWIILLLGIVFKDLIGQMQDAWESNPILVFLIIFLFGGFTFYHIVDLLDRTPKLKVSREELILNKRKFNWAEISSIEIERYNTKEITYYRLLIKPENEKTIRFDITDLDIEHDQLKRAVNVSSGIDFFDKKYST